jgi:hypothetical protein
VTANKEIDVAPWIEPPRSIAPTKRAQWRSLPPSLIGVLGTLLIHALALQTVFVGGGPGKIRPPEVQRPGLTNNSAASPTENLVFVDRPRPNHSDNGIDEALASLRAAMKEKPIPVILPDLSWAPEVEVLALEGKRLDSSSGDGADHARLFGIYTGQIQARVERLWRRPRTPISDGSTRAETDTAEYFQCHVEIVQDSSGNIQEILLPSCNGSIAWQRSLVSAIRQSSPLPAPPSPTVFSKSISLTCVGYPYVDGDSEDGYEVSKLQTAQTSDIR